MKGYLPKFIGVLALVLLCAAPALALVTPSPNFYMPPTPDGDGTYYLRWKAGTSKPVETLNYVLEEATDNLYSDATAIYTGSGLLYKVVANPAGTYYYRVKVVGNTSAEESAYTNGAFPMVVSAPAAVPVANPGIVFVPPTNTTGNFTVSIRTPSATPGATYVIEEHAGPAFDGTTLLNTYPSLLTYVRFQGKADGTYYYRAKAVKAPMADSNWVEGIRSITVIRPLAPAGYAYCINCHSSTGFASDKETSWLASRHGNSNLLPLANTSSCKNCHNANGEAALGEVARVSCETCHGNVGASGHPADTITADKTLGTCGKCHDGHLSYITQKVTASMHNAGGGRYGDSCQRCHTIQGFQNLIGQAADPSDDLNYTAISPTLTAGTAPTCTACHDSHSGALRAVPGWDPNQNGVADQFDTCTACHNYYDNNGVLMAGSTSASNTFHHEDSWYRLLPTTHYDNPATIVGTGPTNILEGYVIRQNGPNPCFDCHSHDLRVNTRRHLEAPTTPDRGETIWTEWAQSGHAGKLLPAKEAAVAASALGGGTSQDQVDAALAAGSNGAEFAWNHYPWSKTSKLDTDGVTVIPDRGDCQKCHTATGYVSKAADPAGYDFNNNDFSHLQDWTALAGSGQAELLYCWGCHSSVETGALRVTGAVTLDYTYGGAAVVIPDLGKSSACIPCHAGRGNANEAARSSRFAGHHAVAGATLFSAQTHVGYEFTGQNYANVGYFAHNNIGVATGEGPCAACHMSGTSHKFEVVTKDAGGIITGINSDVCVTCHDGEHALFVAQSQVGSTAAIWDGTAAVPTVITQEMADAAAAIMEEEAEGYQEAGAILVALTTNTITNYLGHDMNAKWDHDGDAGAVTADVAYYTTDPVDAYGAFQNSKLTADEPGAFAHNRYYAKRLIFDSIDFLEDGAITGVIADYSATYPEAALWLGTLRP